MDLIKFAWTWRYRGALLPLAFLVCVVGLLYIPLPDGITASLGIRIAIGLLVAIVVTYFLWRYQQPAKVRDGSIGIAVAIRSEDDKTQKRVSGDFIATCKKLLAASTTKRPFHLIELNDYHSSLATDYSSADELRKRCGALFLIFGNTAQRKERGKNFYVLRLQGLVCHAPINLDDQSLLAREMNAVLPLKENILEDDELSGFEITSIKLVEATKYVIATAALLSHDAQLAVSLLEEIQVNNKRHKDANVKAIHKLNELAPKRLSAAYRFMSLVHFARWEAGREPDELKKAIEWVEKFGACSNKDNIDVLLVRAIGHFVFDRNIDAAMRCINRCKSLSIANTSWKYSAAFLEAYSDNLDNAKHYYDAAISTEISHDLPFQIEGFIAWILESEPEKQQLNFSLGYINEKFKSDFVSALRYYKKLLGCTPREGYSARAIQHVNNFIEQHDLVSAVNR